MARPSTPTSRRVRSDSPAVTVSPITISSRTTAATSAASRVATPAASATASISSTHPCASTRTTARVDVGDSTGT
ncbi:MAG: hypothetical protein J2P34_07745 [Actinobacteria bacterium]|nr:hypothetical protein [Actinomycetota bacterium]